MRMAEQKVHLLGGEPTLNVYEFDESLLKASWLKVKIFEGYTEEWAEFVLANRNRSAQKPVHDFDIVVGAIADDKVGLQLFRYMRNYIDLPALVENLKYVRLTEQYYFGTERAVDLLKKL